MTGEATLDETIVGISPGSGPFGALRACLNNPGQALGFSTIASMLAFGEPVFPMKQT